MKTWFLGCRRYGSHVRQGVCVLTASVPRGVTTNRYGLKRCKYVRLWFAKHMEALIGEVKGGGDTARCEGAAGPGVRGSGGMGGWRGRRGRGDGGDTTRREGAGWHGHGGLVRHARLEGEKGAR